MAESDNGSPRSVEFERDDAPEDKGHVAYFIFFLLGTGFLLPWNAFITATDYFSLLYPTQHVDTVFAVAYMVPNLAVLLFLVVYMGKNPSRARISTGFFAFFLLVASVPILDTLTIRSTGLGTTLSLSLTVAAVAASGAVDALIQGSLFGMAAELRPKYTQALAAGTSASGLITSGLRMATKVVLPGTEAGLRWSAYLYFSITCAFLFVCAWAYHRLTQLPIMVHSASRRSFTALSSSEAPSLLGPEQGAERPSDPTHPATAGSSSSSRSAGKGAGASAGASEERKHGRDSAEDAGEIAGSIGQDLEEPDGSIRQSPSLGFWEKVFFLDALTSEGKALSVKAVRPGQQWEVLSIVWPYAASVSLVYIVTLSIFPGFISELKADALGSWYPIMLMASFNLFDFFGKMTPVCFVIENDGVLFALVLGRFLFYPLYSACLGTTLLASETLLPLLTSLLGFSNGLLTSLLMMSAPAVVPEDLAEATGTIMVLFLVIGLTLGSIGGWYWVTLHF